MAMTDRISWTRSDRGCRRSGEVARRDLPVSRTAGVWGSSLVEVVVYLALLGVLAGPIILTVIGSTRMSEEANLFTRIAERNRHARHRFLSDFQHCIAGTVAVGAGGKSLAFAVPGNFNGSAPTSGSTIRYDFLDDPTDPANGKDDNSNGVIDEKLLVRSDAATGERVTIGSSFDGAASGFVPDGDGVVVTLTNVGWTKGSRAQTSISKTIVVYPRN